MWSSAVQLAGSAMVLAPFVLAQLGRLRPDNRAYLGLNLAGSGVLAVQAATGAQWGFLLLEGVWALVSLRSLVALARRTAREGDQHAEGTASHHPGGGGITAGTCSGPASGGRGRS
ncbi:MAG: hypothetical protein U0Q15_01770 [Kineosporiaceae bacterium]